AVNEALDGVGWSLELDGPQTYLVFQLQDLQVLQKALSFLQSGNGAEEGVLHLGRFGSASVSLLWDNENFPKCFIIVGPKARSTRRLSMEAEDIQALREAVEQVVKDLPPGSES